MSVFTERQAIRERVVEIREERRELADEHYKLMDRLRELDDMEREAIDTDSIVGSLTEAVRTLQRLVPRIPADVVITQLAEMVKETGIDISVADVQESSTLAPPHIISGQKYNDSEKGLYEKPLKEKKAAMKYPTQEEVKEFDEWVIDTLKEKGTPMRLKEMRMAYLDETGELMHEATFHNRVKKISDVNHRLVKPMRGYYQYTM